MLYDYIVFIARMQPPHLAHIKIVKKALDLIEKKVIIILGSHRAAPNIRNPWTTEEREQMLRSCFSVEENKKIIFITVRDSYYNDTMWLTDIQYKVREITGNEQKIAIIGHNKDNTTYYLDMFPQWDFIDSGRFNDTLIASTKIRESYFGGTNKWEKYTHQNIIHQLTLFKDTERYQHLKDEYNYINAYWLNWYNEDGTPKTKFPVIFVTVDALVVKCGHILLVKRKRHGKGLYALPGGFLKNSEWLEEGCLRELREETKIAMSTFEIKKHIKDRQPFDHPNRSLRGRIITNVFYIKLPDYGDLPAVEGADDADQAMWVSFGDLPSLEDQFFEDHYHIINYFHRV